MVTLKKLKVFERYKGDIDMWSRLNINVDTGIDDDEWRLVDTLIQDVIVIDRKLGSEERTKQASERLRQNCENEAVIAEIRRLVNKRKV
ncbi:MAG: hypothetical protein DMF62_17345 [Acidobacteria bacterium]|nr:MAG: hypothetical protein DMF62_17345 [Acidobacteriota bacterium]